MRESYYEIPGHIERAQRFEWRGWSVLLRKPARLSGKRALVVWATKDAGDDVWFWVDPAAVAPRRWCPAEIARAIMHELRLYGDGE